jgi:hypothetical protein
MRQKHDDLQARLRNLAVWKKEMDTEPPPYGASAPAYLPACLPACAAMVCAVTCTAACPEMRPFRVESRTPIWSGE